MTFCNKNNCKKIDRLYSILTGKTGGLDWIQARTRKEVIGRQKRMDD